MTNQERILLVEDDIILANWIVEYLVEQDYCVQHVVRGDEVMAMFSQFCPDIVLLDVMLPGISGIEVCRQLREHSVVPIIMLTARADEYDEVIGLEAGANDYVIKPVRPRALLARIKNLVQSAPATAQPTSKLDFGQLSIDQQAKRVIYQDQEIDLSTNLFAFLWFLASHAGQVIDRESVFQALKGREYDGLDRRFDVMLSTLRKLFNDDPQSPKKFKTIWGKGYLFVADAWQATPQQEP
ncbi:MAG: response regulator transcription factor [Gammaproteobacteria bacterium]|nr:response regulator transcription factor [Gammaproteobacteria bacterium]